MNEALIRDEGCRRRPAGSLRSGRLAVAAAVVMLAACGGAEPAREAQPIVAAVPSGEGAASSPVPASDRRPRIVILGDSLTAGLGLAQRDSYPTLLQAKVDAAGLDYRVVNAGVSGDTSAGGLSRLEWALDGDVRVLVVALGGNDALRALPADELRRNLSTIIQKAQGRGIRVLLAGMEAPPNFGREYVVSFHQVYPSLAKEFGVTLLPFLLEGVAGVDRLNQNDGIHPTAEGARLVADHVWKALEPIVRSGGSSPHKEAPPG